MAEQRESGWRDKPVEQEADKDLKEGGIAGAKRDVTGETDRAPPRGGDGRRPSEPSKP
jgi:hypothetical protein